MEKKKSSAAPKFGDWEENCHYTTYFEKAARPTTPTPPNPNPLPNPSQIAAAADLIRRRGGPPDPSSSPQPRSSASSQRSNAPHHHQPPPPPPQFRPSAVTWELRNNNRDDIQRNYDSSSSTSSTTSRHLQNRGGRGGEGFVAVKNYQQQIPNYDHDYQAAPNRYAGSAPPTPPRGGGGYATPIEIMSGKGGAVPPKFGDWEGDSNYTQYFENPGGSKNNNKEKKPQQQQQPNHFRASPPPPNNYPKHQTPALQHHPKPTFLPEVQRRVVSTPTPPKSPSYDLHNNTAKKTSSRCWPFRFSSKK